MIYLTNIGISSEVSLVMGAPLDHWMGLFHGQSENNIVDLGVPPF